METKTISVDAYGITNTIDSVYIGPPVKDGRQVRDRDNVIQNLLGEGWEPDTRVTSTGHITFSDYTLFFLVKYTEEEKLQRAIAAEKPTGPAVLDIQNLELPVTKEPVVDSPIKKLLDKGYVGETFSKNVVLKLFAGEQPLIKIFRADIYEKFAATHKSVLGRDPTEANFNDFVSYLKADVERWITDNVETFVSDMGKVKQEAEKAYAKLAEHTDAPKQAGPCSHGFMSHNNCSDTEPQP